MKLFRPLRSFSLLRSVVVVLLLVLANQLIALPYFVFSPGRATSVTPFVQVPPDRSHPPKGDVLFTTVALTHAHPFDIFWAWITPGNRIEKQSEAFGPTTPEEYLRLNDLAMDESKMSAIVVAMRRAGYSVQPTGSGASIRAVQPGSPADGKLRAGDVVVRVNGAPISLASDVATHVAPLLVGSVVAVDVMAGGVARTENVKAGARPDGTPGSYLGVEIQTENLRLNTPFPVEISTSKVGGPSAGLAFTLALLDDLTPGELTGGKKVAVTGTIDPDGEVGPVGGVEQKTFTVNRSGAKLFLVPRGEGEQALAHAAADVKVVEVTTVEEALNALRDNGGDVSGIPPNPAAAAA